MAPQRKTSLKAKTASEPFVPPYPPSWMDRFTAWVDRLPGPAWAFYLALAIGVGLVESAIQWREGAYPAGTLNPMHVWTGGYFAYILGLMHYLDKSAASALASFRPLLVSDQTTGRGSSKDEYTYARLAYELTNLPPRPTLLATLAGASFAIVAHVLLTAGGIAPSYLAGTAGTTLSTAFILAAHFTGNALSGVLAYHTVHQLVLVSRIYTAHAHINIYKIQQLYALSLPCAFTAIGLILMLYVFFATSPASAPQAASSRPVEIGLSLFFATIAGATFALPLIGAHRRLVAEKNRRLAEVSSRFEAAAEELHRQLDDHRLNQLDSLNKALSGLEIESAALRRIATWPWDPGAVRGLVAALLLPIAVWLLQLVLGRVLGA